MDKRPEPLIRADELEDIGAESKIARTMAAQTIRLLYSEKEWYRTKWVGLTKDEVEAWELPDSPTVYEFAQFIEAKLKEKNAND